MGNLIFQFTVYWETPNGLLLTVLLTATLYCILGNPQDFSGSSRHEVRSGQF